MALASLVKNPHNSSLIIREHLAENVMEDPVGPLAMVSCESRQARKGATVAVKPCAGVWLAGDFAFLYVFPYVFLIFVCFLIFFVASYFFSRFILFQMFVV